MKIGAYEQAIKDTVAGRMVPCDGQGTKGEEGTLKERDWKRFPGNLAQPNKTRSAAQWKK